MKGRDKSPHVEQSSLPANTQDKSRIQCYKCHAWGHTVRECPLKKSATEASGSGLAGSGSSSTVTVDEAEEPSGQCQRLQQAWVDGEFQRLSEVYSSGATVDAVEGALGPLFYSTVEIAGTPVNALVDSGLSATILSFELFRTIGNKAGISCIAMQKLMVTLRDYIRPRLRTVSTKTNVLNDSIIFLLGMLFDQLVRHRTSLRERAQ